MSGKMPPSASQRPMFDSVSVSRNSLPIVPPRWMTNLARGTSGGEVDGAGGVAGDELAFGACGVSGEPTPAEGDAGPAGGIATDESDVAGGGGGNGGADETAGTDAGGGKLVPAGAGGGDTAKTSPASGILGCAGVSGGVTAIEGA